MAGFIAGDVVVIPFPFSDLSNTKRRPALVLASPNGPDVVLVQITSRAYSGAVALEQAHFAKGGLKRRSYARPGKLFTAEESLILYRVGTLEAAKLEEIRSHIRKILGG